MQNAIGFYWTLPVPWAGFTTLPEDIDAAAEVSRTIRYQRDLIRRRAREWNFRLILERVFLEIEPDRGSDYVLDALRDLKEICLERDAVVLHVDFREVHGWRRHGALSDWQREARIAVEAVYPDEITIDGQPFDPHRHFSDWRERQMQWTAGKQARVARALEAARSMRDRGRTHKEIAQALNDKGVRSATGKPWTADNVRSLLGLPRD